MLASAFAPASGTAAEGTKADASALIKAPVAAQVENSHPVTLEAYVRDYFADEPVLATIARCESAFRQYNENGEVLRGKVNRGDIGIMQINKYYHQEDAEKLGFDIYTLEGNLGYAKWLYGKYGSDPWVHSSKCWKANPKIALAK